MTTTENAIDLLSLQHMIRDGLDGLFPAELWVRAEISSVQVRGNGHCYLDLSQSNPEGAVAKAKAVIWRARYRQIIQDFRNVAGSDLQAGMSVLLLVQVTYSELYGLTLTVNNLDAEVTLGQQEKIRRETLEKLAGDGLMDRQQELELPLLPYRLAVISARDAAGFGDFCHHLEENEFGFVFEVDLFEAVMQGPGAPASITDALEAVQTGNVRYDAVLIMRGGGSAFDLMCYDDYGLCVSIAQCGIPVFTAIGHDRDHHVADMVAFSCVKTPTALADEFIACFAAEDERISSFCTRLKLAFAGKISAMSSRVDLLVSRIAAADPRAILGRGYALVTDNRGIVLKNASAVGAGDSISVLFSDASLCCTVNSKDEPNKIK